jgi:hypothetical protein
MRVAKTIDDVNIILKQILNRNSSLDTKNRDNKGLKVTNAGDATDPGDYVTLRQLKQVTQQIPTGPDYFSIPFSSDGVVAVGDLVPPYNPGTGRTGKPYEVILSATVPAVSQDLKMNIQINGTNILKNDIDLPIGQTNAVASSDFINNLPMVGRLSTIVPIVTQADGTSAAVTITLVVQLQ